MRLSISTPLEAPAALVWKALRKPQSLRYVAKPLLCFRGTYLTDSPSLEEVVQVERMMFLCVILAWSHELRIVRFDEDEYEILSNERGGQVRVWNHLIKVEPLSEGRCLYTDKSEVHPRALTPFIWLFAHPFYRYRHTRWRSLAQVLGRHNCREPR